jgi:peptide chain release factor
VGLLAQHLVREGPRLGVDVETLETVGGDGRGALLSALLRLEGNGAELFARRFVGTVQWISPSPVRQGHKRKNWFVGVGLFQPVEATTNAIAARDLVIEAMRAGGAGGQHVNKTESAVRITHRPTGIVVTAREERSQHQNKRLAMARLAQKLKSQSDSALADQDLDRWAQHDKLERGQAVATFVGPDFRPKV